MLTPGCIMGWTSFSLQQKATHGFCRNFECFNGFVFIYFLVSMDVKLLSCQAVTLY